MRTNSGLFSGPIFFEPWQLAVGVGFGILMGLGASLVSVGRHLRDV